MISPINTAKSTNGVKLLTLGTVETAGSGCVCPEHVMLRRIINSLVLHRGDVVILDMEAGLEHLGRGTTEGMDMFIVVIEPGARSIRPIRMSNVWPKSLAFIRFMSWQTKYATKKMRHSYRTVSPRRIFWAWSTTTRKLWKRTGKVRLHMITARLQ